MTTEFTEAALEAGIAEAIKRAFPFLPPGAVKHQLVFNVRLGHRSTAVDGRKASRTSGRCDILLVKDDQPLAILELKRPGLRLTDDDRVQGLSYAKLTDPWAPIVIVTNGEDTRIYSTYSGDEWTRESPTEEMFAELIDTTAKIAESDVRRAIQTLIGPRSTVWVELVRRISQEGIKDLTGPADAPLLPFAADLLFPRKASAQIFGYLSHGSRCVLVAGGPLAGKSSVLRGFVLGVDDHEELAALFVDAASSGHGVLQTLANAMTKELGWGITNDDIRNWLIRISNTDSKPCLVLVIDGVEAAQVRSELDEFVSGNFGPNLRLVVAVDNAAIDEVTRNKKGTQLTRIGRASNIAQVNALDDEEFETALYVLHHHRIGFMRGAHRAREYRCPWVLRWIVADAKSSTEYKNEGWQAAFPSMMGLSLVWGTKERFSCMPELIGQYTTLAEAVLDDIDSLGRSVHFSLTSIGSPIARLETARSHLGDVEFGVLVERGYLKHAMLENNERVVVIQIPELLMTTLPVILARRMIEEISDGIDVAARKLVSRCGRLFAGDIIGAQAIVEAVNNSSGLPLEFLEEMLRKPPRQESLAPGSRMTGFIADGLRVEFVVLDDGSIQVTGPDGTQIVIDPEDEEQLMMADMTSWQILSHVAALPFAAQSTKDGSILGRLDPAILIEVGSCPHPVRPIPTSGIDNVRQHDVPGGTVVCHKEGIIEPITFALMRAMLGDRESAEEIIDEAVSRQALPLVLRLYIALEQVSDLKHGETSDWATDVLESTINPILSESGLLH